MIDTLLMTLHCETCTHLNYHLQSTLNNKNTSQGGCLWRPQTVGVNLTVVDVNSMCYVHVFVYNKWLILLYFIVYSPRHTNRVSHVNR